jgi:proteic killer suppression protein
MIASFASKGLMELFETGKTAKIDAKMQKKALRILDALDKAKRLEDLNLPGFGFHSLKGHNPRRYAMSVNGPWRVTFEFDGVDARGVDFEQYH